MSEGEPTENPFIPMAIAVISHVPATSVPLHNILVQNLPRVHSKN